MPGEREYFHRYANKHKYRMFDGPSIIRHKNARGCVILLVRYDLRCRLISILSEEEGQVVTVMVENIAVTSWYQPPQESRIPAACHILESLQLLPRGTPWVGLGDWNDTPDENHLVYQDDTLGLHTCFVQNKHTGNLPLRDGQATVALTTP